MLQNHLHDRRSPLFLCFSPLIDRHSHPFYPLVVNFRKKMEVWSNEMTRWKIPEFGNWGYYEGLPITHYLESASQAGLIQSGFCGDDEDLFTVPVAMPVKCRRPYAGHYRQKAPKTGGAGTETNYSKEQKQRKQRKVCNAADCPPRMPRAPMAVDEDLYKIPPELLYQKPKTKRLLRNLISGCMGLNCH